MGDVIRVLLVDDQDLVRYGFRLVIESEDDLEVIGEARDGVEAVDATLRSRPDVVIMDVRMPRRNGIDATEQILAIDSRIRVLILTTWDLDDYAFGALTAGAAGFLLKESRPDELVNAIRAVNRGDSIVSPRITSKLVKLAVPHLGVKEESSHDHKPLSLLSGREVEVLTLVARGLTNTQIAEALFLSESTVKTHFGRILEKLALPNRVQAVIYAYDTGIVSLNNGGDSGAEERLRPPRRGT